MALLRSVVASTPSVITPTLFHEQLVIDGARRQYYRKGDQMDAQEFLFFLIDSLPSLKRECTFSERTVGPTQNTDKGVQAAEVPMKGGSAPQKPSAAGETWRNCG